MDYVYTAVLSAIVGFVGGHYFSKQLAAAVAKLEATIETRLKGIESAVLSAVEKKL